MELQLQVDMTTNDIAKSVGVPVRQLPHAAGLPLPAYQSDGAAGLDLLAAVAERKPVTLAPGARALLPTGLIVGLPNGFEAQIRPRSGLALRHGLTVLNSPGTIDSDYRGEVQVLLINLGDAAVVIRRGDRIAQMVIAPVARARLRVTLALGETDRGAGGFGSTGVISTVEVPAAVSPAAKAKTAAKAAKSKLMPKSRKVSPRAARGKSVARRAGGKVGGSR